eukprot:365942-Chlamydomonas_euryale.AAC.73
MPPSNILCPRATSDAPKQHLMPPSNISCPRATSHAPEQHLQLQCPDLPLPFHANPRLLSAQARAYDLVYNGVEIGGGSLRIYRRDIQSRVFDLIGLSPAEAQVCAHAHHSYMPVQGVAGVAALAGACAGFRVRVLGLRPCLCREWPEWPVCLPVQGCGRQVPLPAFEQRLQSFTHACVHTIHPEAPCTCSS